MRNLFLFLIIIFCFSCGKKYDLIDENKDSPTEVVIDYLVKSSFQPIIDIEIHCLEKPFQADSLKTNPWNVYNHKGETDCYRRINTSSLKFIKSPNDDPRFYQIDEISYQDYVLVKLTSESNKQCGLEYKLRKKKNIWSID